MATLVHQRCFNHAVRQAAARCPHCERFFCRECITEHAGQVVCALCLKQLTEETNTGRVGWGLMVRAAQISAGLLVAWLFFFWVGLALLSIDSSFHDGSVWNTNWLFE